jgi:hypothetical protein
MLQRKSDEVQPSRDPRLVAGREAERQLRFYLSRAFGADRDILVLNDVRLVDDADLFGDGQRNVSQIDHLVLHPWGAFVIESKSCVTGVRVRAEPDGRDEWERATGRDRWRGMPSPVQQARRQGDHLQRLLHHHRHTLRQARTGLGGLVTRMFHGEAVSGFTHMPIQLIVSIGDRGRIERTGWEPPTEPFRTAVLKADHVTDFVQREVDTHRRNSSLLTVARTSYGVWQLTGEELRSVASFVAEQHRPRPMRAAVVDPERGVDASAKCKACASIRLVGAWGRYGYHWKCTDCGANTSMPKACPDCASRSAKIHKSGPQYERRCPDCGGVGSVWREPSPGSSLPRADARGSVREPPSA